MSRSCLALAVLLLAGCGPGATAPSGPPPDPPFNALALLPAAKDRPAGQELLVKVWKDLKGHEAELACLAYSSDGKRLASMDVTDGVRIWDEMTGATIASRQVFAGHHEGAVRSLAFSPDGKHVAALSGSQSKLLDAETLDDRNTVEVPKGEGMYRAGDGEKLRFSRNGDKLYVLAKHDLQVWDTSSWQLIHERRGVTSHRHTLGLSADEQTVVVDGPERRLRLVDVQTGEVSQTLDALTGSVASAAFSPDGTLVAANTASTGSGEFLIVWEVTTGKVVWSESSAFGYQLSFSADGRLLLCDDNAYDARTGYRWRNFDRGGHLVASPDGISFAGGSPDDDHAIRVWDRPSGLYERTIGEGNKAVITVAVSPDGKTLATGGKDDISVWSTATGEQQYQLKRSGDWISDLAFSGDGRWLISLASRPDPAPVVWDLATRKEARKLAPPCPVAQVAPFGGEGHFVAGGGDDTSKLVLVGDGREFRTLGQHELRVECVAVTPDGTRAASGSIDGSVRVWDVAKAAATSTFAAHHIGVRALALSADAKTLATLGGPHDRREFKLWNADTAKNLHTFVFEKEEGAASFALTPDGKTLLVGGDDGMLRVFDATTAKLLATHLVSKEYNRNNRVARIVVYDGGRRFAVLGADDKLRVGRIADLLSLGGKRASAPKEALPGPEYTVTGGRPQQTFLLESVQYTRWKSVAIAGDSTLVAACGVLFKPTDTGYLAWWNAETGQRVHQLTFAGQSPEWLAFSADGKSLWTVLRKTEGLGILKRFDLATAKELRSVEIPVLEYTRFAISPGEQRLATGGIQDRSVALWDTATGTKALALDSSTESYSVAFSPDGRFLATGEFFQSRLWDAKTGTAIRPIGKRVDQPQVAFSPSGNLVVAGTESGAARNQELAVVTIFDLGGRTLVSIREPAGSLAQVSFSTDGESLIAGFHDGVVVWDAKTGKRRRTLNPHHDFSADAPVAMAPNGKFLVAAGGEKLHRWDLDRLLDLEFESNLAAVQAAGGTVRQEAGELEIEYRVEGTIAKEKFSHFAGLKHLNVLRLGPAAQLADAELAQLPPLKHLHTMELSGAGQITDAGLAHVAKLPALGRLTLVACDRISEKGLSHLAAAPTLRALTLQRTPASPKGIGQLQRSQGLRHLHFEVGAITAEQIAAIAKLTSLEELDLIVEKAPMAALKSLGALTNLKRLRLAAAGLSDEGISFVAQLTGLEQLSLDSVYLGDQSITSAGLVHLRPLAKLRELRIVNAEKVTDEGLAHLAGLTKLASIDLARTHVTGLGLRHLSKMPDLTQLNLSDMRTTDTGMAGVAQLTQLRLLVLGYEIGDEGLMHLGPLVNLESLDLSATKVGDKGFAALVGMKKLRDLKLKTYDVMKDLTGEGLRHLAGLAKLTELDLSHTGVTDAGLTHIRGLTQLKKLKLPSDSRITDAGIAHLASLKHLDRLDVSHTSLTNAGLEPLASLSKLKSLDVSRTNVTEKGREELRKKLPECWIPSD